MKARVETTDRLWLVIPAAGIGHRFGNQEPKQYLTIGRQTVLEHSLSRMLSVGGILGAAVAVHAEDVRWQELNIFQDGRVRVVPGGQERAESVLAALQALHEHADDDDWVLVHDAARPCIDPVDVRNMIGVLVDHPVGGIMACPVADTLKRSDEHGDIVETVDRQHLWRAQTPQMFRYRLLVESLKSCLEQGLPVTDEASALEALGHRPSLFRGSDTNIKITHREDLQLARLLLGHEESGDDDSHRSGL